MKEGDTEG